MGAAAAAPAHHQLGQSAEDVRQQIPAKAEDEEGERDGGDGAADPVQPGQRGALPRHPGQAAGGDAEPAGVQAEHRPHRQVRGLARGRRGARLGAQHGPGGPVTCGTLSITLRSCLCSMSVCQFDLPWHIHEVE